MDKQLSFGKNKSVAESHEGTKLHGSFITSEESKVMFQVAKNVASSADDQSEGSY